LITHLPGTCHTYACMRTRTRARTHARTRARAHARTHAHTHDDIGIIEILLLLYNHFLLLNTAYCVYVSLKLIHTHVFIAIVKQGRHGLLPTSLAAMSVFVVVICFLQE